jgi:ATP-dependent RNA helicase HelY
MFGMLKRDNLLPTILFRSSRRQCNEDVEALSRLPQPLVSPIRREKIKEKLAELLEKYQIPPEVLEEHEHYRVLTEHAIGAHHAGQLLVWRLFLEELMAAGLLRIMIATGTVAAGVDFPARSVVITAHSKRGNDGFNVITSSEFQQMSGRAGRRGKDTVGVCVVAPNPYCDARIIHDIAQRPPEPLSSAYFASPSTVLNLLKYRNVDDLVYTVKRSLGSFLDRKAAKGLLDESVQRQKELHIKEATFAQAEVKRHEKRIKRLEREAEKMQQRQAASLQESLDGLQRLGYVYNGALTEKGSWAAALCSNLVLELGEAIEAKVFDGLNYRNLAALIASIAGDSYRHYFSLRDNPIAKDSFEQMRTVCARVNENYQSPLRVPSEVVPDAALTVLMWLDSSNWSDFSSLLRLAGVAEGDVSRLVSQTAEHLNQISHLTLTHPVLAQVAAEARMKLLRPPLSDAFTS